jgi:signal transduction histidine kinase
LSGEEAGKQEVVMEERDGRQDDRMLLTQEEEDSLTLLEPLFARHRDLIFEILPCYSRRNQDGASVLTDDLASARLTRVQQEHPLSLPNGVNEGSIDREGGEAGDACDPFSLGAGQHLQTILHFLISIQPLVFEAFGSRPHVHHRVWNALLKVVFHDLELAMGTFLKQRDDLVEAAVHDASEARRTLELELKKQTVEEQQRLAEHRTVVSLLTIWLTKTSELACEMGSPLNVILGRAESLLERAEDDKTQAALQSILSQVEQLISLRRQLCALDHGFNSKPPSPDCEIMEEGPRA